MNVTSLVTVMFYLRFSALRKLLILTKQKYQIKFREPIAYNDLRANEGRETKALNCKPNTNLKEISELSNYSKTSGFRLHAVTCRFTSYVKHCRYKFNHKLFCV
jgi:hypothetical protein